MNSSVFFVSKKLIWLSLFYIISSCQPDTHSNLLSETTIKEMMQRQENCWNQGDIPCFMEGYWKSDSLKFVGRSGITYGWQPTLDNYLKSYPDRAAMGTLTFNLEVLQPLEAEHYFVIGSWTLKRATDQPSGYFSLIWKKIDGDWVIIADHSS